MGQWIVDVRSFQKIFGLYGLKHHIVEISGDVTDAGRDGTGQTTSEDRATQLLIWETLSLAIVKNGLVWYSWYGLDGSEFTAIYQSQYTGRYIAARIVAVIFRKIF